MKYLACGDIHIRKEAPRYRKDNYYKAALRKLLWIVDEANKQDATLLIAGDLFDSALQWSTVNAVMAILQQARYQPLVIPGQHDMRFHSDIKTTPIYNLAVAGTILLLSNTDTEGGDVSGVGWEEDPPKEGNRILLMHKCVTPDTPPFFLKDAVSAEELVKLYPNFNIYVTGDYHHPFHKMIDDKIVINCGTIMRNKKDMLDFKGYVYLIDAKETKASVRRLEVPMNTASAVFDIVAIEYEKEHGIVIATEKLKELMLASDEAIEFEDVVNKVFKELKPKEQPSPEIVKEVLNNALPR